MCTSTLEGEAAAAAARHKVAVIGGGIAGVAVARALRARGITFTLFERKARVGGLWVTAYPGAATQAVKHMYELPEMRFPASVPEHPRAEDVVAYLEAYVLRYDLARHMRLETEVLAVRRESRKAAPAGAAFVVTYQSAGAPATSEEFTFAIVCNGITSERPVMPEVPGREVFAGVTMHSSAWRSLDEVRGKRVLVVGGGKSAMDVALAASRAGSHVVQAMRTMHWYIPDKIAHVIPFGWPLFGRGLARLLPIYPGERHSAVYRAVHALAAPLRWFVWRGLEAVLLAVHYRLPRHQWPRTPIEYDALLGSTLVFPDEYMCRVRAGEIDLRIASAARFTGPREVTLSTGHAVAADVVVFATGFECGLGVLDAETRAALRVRPDGLHLYRYMLHPAVPGLAFCLSNTLGFSSPATAALQAAWLGDYLCGRIAVPDAARMAAEVERERAAKAACVPESRVRGACVAAVFHQLNDRLLRDRGVQPQRFGGTLGWLANWVVPFDSAHLDGCTEVAAAAPATLKVPRGFAFAVWSIVAVACAALVRALSV